MSDLPKTVFKGVWIPAEVWESSELSWMQKCLWATVSSLGRKESPCTAGNEWLAERMETSPESVAKMLSRMRALGYVHDVGFDGRRRSILAVIPSESVKAALTPESTLPLPQSQSSHDSGVNPDGVLIYVENKGKNKDKKEEPQAALPEPPTQDQESSTAGQKLLTSVLPPAVPKARKAFVRPTLEEVKAFAVSQGLPALDGSAFFYGKEGNGWKGVKDWRAALKSWKLNGYLPSQKAGRNNGDGKLNYVMQ